ncbi:hypothetical protein F5B22DRAFT_573748 [Xylaria bambusicola]|uniref:uncharacterized protein n=1 Tax=Xylaria bambusicola TaxID=326684 RepID=UPI0020071F9C|nr:uncharacterized protein F5B22DRAFT_573748 [Xylaria bambusicola]KAI0521451.1 hypothetical protein F5B22DRAFT_573748 [Xylaria bambusicola]
MAPPDLNSLPQSSPVPTPLHPTAMTSTTTPTSTNGNANASTSMSLGGDRTRSEGGGGEPALRGESPSPSPRSASISLQAAATVNAGLQHESGRRPSVSSLSRQRQSPQTGRRRSVVLMNLQLNDPTLPAPGELVAGGANNSHNNDNTSSPQPFSLSSPLLTGREPTHNRAPSLGELHQELEAEQEAQVNRLLQMIRQQQLQLQQLQAAHGQSQSTVAAEDPPSTSDRSASLSHPPGVPPSLPTPSGSIPRSPSISHPRSSFDLARDALHRRSRTPSRGASSPRLRSTSISQEGEPHLSGVRDETTYYQAETQSLIRENQMLRHRIRELERQISEAQTSVSVTREPVQPSQLTHSTSVSEADAGQSSSS